VARSTEIEALRALSEQHGMPGIDLTQIVIVLEHLDAVPRELAETNRILPVLVRGDRIFLPWPILTKSASSTSSSS
jgi:hypothetical protein